MGKLLRVFDSNMHSEEDAILHHFPNFDWKTFMWGEGGNVQGLGFMVQFWETQL